MPADEEYYGTSGSMYNTFGYGGSTLFGFEDPAQTAYGSGQFASEIRTSLDQLSASEQATIRANAASVGMTAQQYLTTRGGLTGAGYYGDTPAYRTLSSKDYYSFFGQGGGGVTALNRESANRELKNLIDGGLSREDALKRMISQGWRPTDLGLTSDEATALGLDPSVVSGGSAGGAGGVSGGTAGGAGGAGGLSRDQIQAKAIVGDWLSTFFDPVRDADTIKKMNAFLDGQILEDLPAEAIMLNIRQQDFYKQRFKGNEGLRAAGLAELDPADYLRAERMYSDILNNSGLSNLARRDTFSSLIGGQVSAAELEDRVTNVYLRIQNADQPLKDEMRRLNQLGNLTSADFAEALLTGREGAALLRRKIATAEVSTEFTQRGISSAIGAEELARMGINREQARAGAEYAATGTERLTSLADIYNVNAEGIQSELESEAFKGLASQRRRRLVGSERAAFAGSSGTASPSLGSSTIGAI